LTDEECSRCSPSVDGAGRDRNVITRRRKFGRADLADAAACASDESYLVGHVISPNFLIF
jgi:hypothetical protein